MAAFGRVDRGDDGLFVPVGTCLGFNNIGNSLYVGKHDAHHLLPDSSDIVGSARFGDDEC